MYRRLPVRWLVVVVAMLSAPLVAQQIRGDYIETRTSDIYTGQCFANSEVNLVGKEAILAWHVESGSWDGVALDGLSVAAAIHARATLGDPYGNPYPATSVILVEERATPGQRAALVSFARQMGGPLLEDVGQVIPTTLEMIVNHQRHGVALLRAGRFATVETRSLTDQDHVCGNEVTFYPPLTQVAHSMPAVAVTDAYDGPGLGESWDLHGQRSAFVGTFVR
ncbi:MAG TPA: DUF1326 domain-containing protein [Terriglobales bacterium]|nr:DUF1326 domain-containing protein [Terriglobales bacterium]